MLADDRGRVLGHAPVVVGENGLAFEAVAVEAAGKIRHRHRNRRIGGRIFVCIFQVVVCILVVIGVGGGPRGWRGRSHFGGGGGRVQIDEFFGGILRLTPQV